MLREMTREELAVAFLIDDLYVGQLTPDELIVFNKMCEDGLARRVYQNILGLAKVDILVSGEAHD